MELLVARITHAHFIIKGAVANTLIFYYRCISIFISKDIFEIFNGFERVARICEPAYPS